VESGAYRLTLLSLATAEAQGVAFGFPYGAAHASERQYLFDLRKAFPTTPFTADQQPGRRSYAVARAALSGEHFQLCHRP